MLKKTIPEEVTEFIAKEDQRLRSGVCGKCGYCAGSLPRYTVQGNHLSE